MVEKICIILLFNLVYFLKTIGYKYVSDDIPSFNVNPKPRNKLEKLFLMFRGSYKSNPQRDHFITLIIHATVCVFIYTAFGYSNISFLAALLFSINPINNQGSIWISGRGYVLSALFILMTITIPILVPLFLWCSTYYNLGYVSPLVLIGSPVWWTFCLVPVFWLLRYKKFKGDVLNKVKTEMFAVDKEIHWRKLVLATKTFGFYITHALIPVKTTFYHSFLQSAAGSGKGKAFTMKDRFFWIGLFALLGIGYYWLCFTWNMVSFGLLWWCIGIGPFLNLMRMSQEIAERYAYLPTIGLMYVLASILMPYPMLQAGFFMMYATKLWFYMDAYQDDYYIAEYSHLYSPDSWFALHVKAMKRWEGQSHHEAMIFWTMALAISPKEFKLLVNVATCLMLAKKQQEAEKYLQLAKENIPAGQEKQANEILDKHKKGEFAILL